MIFFKQKIVWLSTLIVLVVLVVFGAAMMGSVLGTKPKDVPVALVVLDQPAQLPSGGTLAVGAMMKEKLTASGQLPISWKLVGSEEAAREGLNDRDYYGALILPADLSAGVASLAGPSPKPATVQIIANEGMNTQAATVVKQALGQVIKMAGAELSASLLEQMGQQADAIPVTAAKSLLSPFQVQEETVHAVGANNASGNAPGSLTQIMWLGSLVTGVLLFLAGGSARKGGAGRWASVVPQPVAGIVIVGAASAFLVWMASGWYGMELAQAVDTWLFLWLAGAAFFLLQSALLNWIGFPAMAILVLLMFFSMPLLNMAPEFLSSATHDWIYSWTPLRFAASGTREVMYYGGLDAVSRNAAVLWSIAGGFLLLQLASAFKKVRAPQAASASSTAAKG
ncbi:YhgE/Pip domain-containing protein [Paenibacillus kobensis]|uniref:YhgE/Pip domain-containing protein n=1 Tax=Paenibacillus kobensis TaxID=59841 RepID=UPI000FD7DEF3|nr:ABC transporter permease [Paenibacillus kobensis]